MAPANWRYGGAGEDDRLPGALVDPARGHLGGPGDTHLQAAGDSQIDHVGLIVVGLLPPDVAALAEMGAAQLGPHDAFGVLRGVAEARVA